jgi:hypothetical protein
MATTTNITTTYAGEFAGKYISPALLAGSTLSKGLVNVMSNVIFKEVIQRVDLDDILKDASCDFDATSTLTLTERVIEPKELSVNLSLCKSQFVKSWQAIEANPSAHRDMPKSFQDYVLGYVAAKTAQKIETNIWQGVATNAGEFDGFETLAKADANVIDVLGTAVTPANVKAELQKAIDSVPNRLYGKEDLTIYAAANVFRAYITALGSDGYVDKYNNQMIDVLFFNNTKIVMVDGMSDNTMLVAQKDNLHFGTGLLSDTQMAKVLDMSDLDGSDNIRIIMKMTGGVQYGISEDIVLYATV